MEIKFNHILNLLLVGVVVLLAVRYFYMQPRFINGEAVPDFTAATLEGEQLQLSSLRGNLVLLDFWGSWCGPCRVENRALVTLYGQYRDTRFEDGSRFEIVSIGVEEEEQRWRRAIERDGLSWPYHILDKASSLRFFDSELASRFGVKQLPTKYLISADGRIIAVNPSIEELSRILEEKAAGNS